MPRERRRHGSEGPAPTPAPFLPYARIFESLLDGVLVANADGRIVLANRAAARVFDVRQPDLLVPISEYGVLFGLREPDGKPTGPIATRALRGEVVPPMERLILTPRGIEKSIRTSAAPLRDDHGAIIGAAILVADVSAARREAERARAYTDELRRANEAARAAIAERQLALDVLEHGQPMYVLDGGFRFMMVNRAWERITGIPRAMALGSVLWELLPGAASPSSPYWTELRRVLQQRVEVEFEDREAPLGLCLSVRAYPMGDQGIAVFFSDITARNRAESILRERETELKLAQRIAHVGSWAWVVGTERLEASEEVYRIYGRDPSLPIPTNDSEDLRRHYTPDGWARRAAAFRRALADGLPWEREEQIVQLDGTRRWVHFRGEPERDASGRIVKLRGTIQDITERKQSEDALRESEQRFRALADAMPQIVCVLAWNGTPEYVNPTWVSYSGLDEDATARIGWEAIVHPGDVGAARACWERARQRRTVEEVEIRFRAVDGSYGWFLCRLAPIQGEDGRVARFIGAGMNIDERRRTEALLQYANEQLREANANKNDFLGVLSHELRNPLAAIRNGTHVLQRTTPDAPQAKRARQIIARQTDHLARLVDDLLDITRISRGKIQLRRERLDLRDIVRRACEDHRSLFEEGSLALTVDVPEAPVWVDADPTRVGQVIANLLSNASKFTPPRGSVAVQLRQQVGEAEIRVRDTGLGMEPQQIERMFEAFVQEDRTLARTRGGLGLGLALSKALVELHGGRICARSAGPGTGSEFEIALPISGEPPR